MINKGQQGESSMKKVIVLLAAMSLSASAFAEVKHDGEFRLRYNNMMDSTGVKDANDGGAGFEQRAKLGLSFRNSEKIAGQVTMLHNTVWGANADQEPGTGTGTAITETNGLLVLEAWGWWKATDALSWKFGRGGMTMADGTVVSANDYESNPKAFDGALGIYDTSFAGINFFGVKGAELGAGALTNDAEANFYGLSFNFKNLPDFLKLGHFHFMQVNTDRMAGTSVPNHMRLGLTAKGDAAGLDYRLSYAMNTGKYLAAAEANDIDSAGSMMELELGFAMPEMMKSRISFLYHSDNGTDSTGTKTKVGYDTFHYEKHDNAGLMDILGWGNLTHMQLAYNFSPMDDLAVDVRYGMFSRTHKDHTAVNATGATVNYQANGTGLSATTGDTAETDLGTELDISVDKKYGEDFSMGLRYGMFNAGKFYTSSNVTTKADQTISQLWYQAKMTF
jgi:hypothetical protein